MIFYFLLSTVHGLRCEAAPAHNLTDNIELCLHFGPQTTRFRIPLDTYAKLIIQNSSTVGGNPRAFISVSNKDGGGEAIADAVCNNTGSCKNFDSQEVICESLQSCIWVAKTANVTSRCAPQPRTDNDVISSCDLAYTTATHFAPIGNVIIELTKGNIQRIRIDNSCSNCGDNSVVKSHREDADLSATTCMCGESLVDNKPTEDYSFMVSFAGTDAGGNPLTSEDKSYGKFVSGSVTLKSFTSLIAKHV